ncbi:MAG: LVIVD repeat-containing protein [Nitrospinota bacterium]
MSRFKRFHGTSKNVRRVGRTDVPGGGQVTVVDGRAYIGHMRAPHGTTILDVSDPKNIRTLSHIEIPEGIHTHKVRARDGLMLTNVEQSPKGSGAQGGLKIYDVSDPARPRELAFFRAANTGVHRFDFDGRYAYLSPEMEGYRGNIVLILDLRDPERPEEAGRWWLPGQWVAGGETPDWEGTRHKCHHPLRLGDRLYTSYWHGGFVILDIADLSRPRMVSRLDWSPPYPCPTHTALPIPHEIQGRRFLAVTDEDIADRLAARPNGWFWMVDITDETNPIPVSTWSVPQDHDFNPDEWFGAHQPQEQVYENNLLCVTWFAGGLRVLDVSDPYRPEEVGYFIPEPGKGQTLVQSNDVFVGGDGLIYLLDRFDGLDILEFTG